MRAIIVLILAAPVLFLAYALGAGYIQVLPKALNQLLAVVVLGLFVWFAFRVFKSKGDR